MTVQDISRLYDYTDWATNKVLGAAQSLTLDQLYHDFKFGHHSIFETLIHTMGAEWVWLERWKGESPTNLLDHRDYTSVKDIELVWQSIEEDRKNFISTLTDDKLSQPLEYKNLAGNIYHEPLEGQMTHCANHATHHRGQLVGYLRALGAQVPVTDFIAYLREKNS
jgi:uncharacterized damage-inducible protein DinB